MTTLVVMVAALGLMSTMSTAYAADRTTRDQLDAQHIARDLMEGIEATSYETLLSLDGGEFSEPRFVATVSVSLVAVGLLRSEVAVVCDSNPSANMRLVALHADRR